MTTTDSMPQSPGMPSARAEKMRAYLRQDPANEELLLDLADVEAAADDWTSAEARYAEAIRLAPRNLRGWHGLVRTLLVKADAPGALAAVLSARRFAPDDPGLRFAEGYARALTGDHAGAWQAIAGAPAAIELDEPARASVTRLAQAEPGTAALAVRVLHHLGRPAAARQLGEALLAGGDTDAALLGALCAVCSDQGDREQAASLARRALAMDPGQNDATTFLAMDAALRGAFDGAKRGFASVLSRHPGDGRALLGAGLTAMLDGNFEESETHLARAKAAMPGHPDVEAALGLARIARGQLARAQRDFATARAGRPRDATLAALHALALAAEGKQVEARTALDQGLAMDPHSPVCQLLATRLTRQGMQPEDWRAVATHIISQSACGARGLTITPGMESLLRRARKAAG